MITMVQTIYNGSYVTRFNLMYPISSIVILLAVNISVFSVFEYYVFKSVL